MRNSSPSSPTATASSYHRHRRDQSGPPGNRCRLPRCRQTPQRAGRSERETDYLEIINNINRLIDRQKAILATRKTINAKRATQKPKAAASRGRKDRGNCKQLSIVFHAFYRICIRRLPTWKNTARKEIRRQKRPATMKISGLSAIR